MEGTPVAALSGAGPADTHCEVLLGFEVLVQVDAGPVVLLHRITGQQLSGRERGGVSPLVKSHPSSCCTARAPGGHTVLCHPGNAPSQRSGGKGSRNSGTPCAAGGEGCASWQCPHDTRGHWRPETQGGGGTGARPGPCTATARPPGPWGSPGCLCVGRGGGSTLTMPPGPATPSLPAPWEAEHRAQLPACPPPQDTEEEASLNTVPLGHSLISQPEKTKWAPRRHLGKCGRKGSQCAPRAPPTPQSSNGKRGASLLSRRSQRGAPAARWPQGRGHGAPRRQPVGHTAEASALGSRRGDLTDRAAPHATVVTSAAKSKTDPAHGTV